MTVESVTLVLGDNLLPIRNLKSLLANRFLLQVLVRSSFMKKKAPDEFVDNIREVGQNESNYLQT